MPEILPWKTHAGASGVQSQPRLPSKLGASLGFRKQMQKFALYGGNGKKPMVRIASCSDTLQ